MLIGLPSTNLPKVDIQYSKKTKLPFSSEHSILENYHWSNQQKLKGLETATLNIYPLISSNEYYQTITVKVIFNKGGLEYIKLDKEVSKFLKERVMNWKIAQNWIKKRVKKSTGKIVEETGYWLNFFLNEDNIYFIDHPTLNSQVNMSNVDPRSISFYMHKNLGRSKSRAFNQNIEPNLIEVPILVEGEEDGLFDPDDRIIFFGNGSSGYDIFEGNLNWKQNLYYDQNSCWVFIPSDNNKRGKRITNTIQPNEGTLVDYGMVSFHIEPDLINPESSGIEWLWSPISSGNAHTILVDLNNPKSGINFSFEANFKGNYINDANFSQHKIKLLHGSLDGPQIGSSLIWSGNSTRTLNGSSIDFDLNNGSNLFFFKNYSDNPNSNPYIDYFDLRYGMLLDHSNSSQFFSALKNQKVEFSFSGQKASSSRLWDVTDLESIVNLEFENSGNCFAFVSDSINRYIYFKEDDIKQIESISLSNIVSFNTLRNNHTQTNYVIVGPKSFKDEAEPLMNLRSAIFADLENIYHEFAAGNKDPMAIRTFLQWTQEEWQSPVPNFLLLLGDSGYDYRNINGLSKIIVPTFQVQASRSYATDDLFSCIYGNIPEFATGRFPARNEEEVIDFVDKVLQIELEPLFGPWRQSITIIADDAARPEPNHGSISTGQSHTINSEQISEIIPSKFSLNKLYLLEFPEVSDASAYGVIKPQATEQLIDYINTGTSLISYIGHGSPTQLAQEKLLDLNRGDINQLETGKKLPLWIVGTCSFGHFDDPQTESFAEELIRSRMNAASIVISTSRPITVVGNERYTKDLFQAMFDDKKVTDESVGFILQAIKDGTAESQYFNLFGDPALKLPMPLNSIDSISLEPDTLRTLEIGMANVKQSELIQSGQGFVIFTDANRLVNRQYEISSETYSLSYSLPGATLFRGLFTFDNENFNTKIRVPKDISYSNKPGKLSIYIYNDDDEAFGTLENIHIIGGEEIEDDSGPIITFETSTGKVLNEGDHFYFSEDLKIQFYDPIGINITNETGHEIKVKNLETNQEINVTNKFFYHENSINSGNILYKLENEEFLNIEVIAWDNANNPTQKQIKLFSTDPKSLKLFNCFNYPNPFKTSTQFSFEVTQNSDINLKIFSLAGRRVKSFSFHNVNAGFHIIDWNGRNEIGGKISRGVYIYKLEAKSDNSKSSYIGKCAKY